MQQIFTISRCRAKMAAMDIFKLPPSRVKPISVFRSPANRHVETRF
jgi:hypothetical protein